MKKLILMMTLMTGIIIFSGPPAEAQFVQDVMINQFIVNNTVELTPVSQFQNQFSTTDLFQHSIVSYNFIDSNHQVRSGTGTIMISNNFPLQSRSNIDTRNRMIDYYIQSIPNNVNVINTNSTISTVPSHQSRFMEYSKYKRE